MLVCNCLLAEGALSACTVSRHRGINGGTARALTSEVGMQKACSNYRDRCSKSGKWGWIWLKWIYCFTLNRGKSVGWLCNVHHFDDPGPYPAQILGGSFDLKCGPMRTLQGNWGLAPENFEINIVLAAWKSGPLWSWGGRSYDRSDPPLGTGLWSKQAEQFSLSLFLC